MKRKNDNKFSVYLKDSDIERISFYQNQLFKVFRINTSVSAIISRLINEKKSIDDLILEVMIKNNQQQKEEGASQ
jgi:hypothetical protein